MPIAFQSESETDGVYFRVHMPQNRYYIKTNDGETTLEDKVFACDVNNLKMGWLQIDQGLRDWQEWPSLGQRTAQPSPEHKQGFEVPCYAKVNGVMTKAMFSDNGVGKCNLVAKIYNEAEKCPEFKQDMLPVIQVTDSTPVVKGKGTSYDVSFVIKTWVARPAETAAEETPAPAPAPAPTPAPAAAPAGDDFGFN